jgi:glycerol-3-phosphate dehydrogenase (NAD(P)+)
MSSVAVLGGGAWGSALAIQAARAGASVTLWARHPDRFAGGASPRLPGAILPYGVRVTGEPPRGADAVLVAVPMQHVREVLSALRPDGPLLLCCKGMEQGSGLLPLEVAGEVLPGVAACVLSGPNFAHEIAAGKPAASVLAGTDKAVRDRLIAQLTGGGFRLYGNDDVLGVQIGGAAKNVIAIGAGALVGGGYGENARAGLITRGLAELSRLVVSQGGRAETVAGLSGLGDLVLTCTGAGSRNYHYGVALGRGERVALGDDAPVVEGVSTAPALLLRAGGLDLPICQWVVALIEGRVTLREAMAEAMARRLRDE